MNVGDAILCIGNAIMDWMCALAVGDVVVVWLTCSLVAYVLMRRSHKIRKWSWDHRDVLLAVFFCLLGGPFMVVLTLIFNMHFQSVSDWLDKPSRW